MDIEKNDVEWLITTILVLIQMRMGARDKKEPRKKKPPNRRKPSKHKR